ncbi:MAG: hypothetical protein HZB16_19200 [Armatimonadetes bacterium]|nr:hypothetical protein [Armatimonadota bacterium]
MRQRGLQGRITWSGAGVLAATAAVIIIYGTAVLSSLSRSAATRELSAVAEAKASEVESSVGIALNTARTLSSMVLGAKGSAVAGSAAEADAKAGAKAVVSREQFMSQLRVVTEQRKGILGTYVGFEPNAYDGRDKDYVKAPGHDDTGRFVPYLVRNPDGKLDMTPLADYENKDLDDRGQRKGEYYLRPKETKQECIVDPYEYEVGGQKILMTSLLSPILENGNYIGMAGADIDLKFIQEMIEKTSIYDGKGSLILVSTKGWVAGMTGRKEMVGKQLKEAAPSLAGMIDDIAAGKEGQGNIGGMLTVRHPVRFGDCATPWAVIVQVPRSVIGAVARRAMFRLSLLALVCVIGGALAMGLSAQRVAAPVTVAIGRMGEAANHVANGSGQVASSSGDLASNASEQASSLEETSASLEQMSSMTAQNADNAQQAAAVAEQAKTAAQQGDAAMLRMVQTMDDIQASSEKTAAILKTIDEIAFQTNLLALNAAVEAARAGDAGRGFAVVAEEVRNLAKRSAEASRTTAGMIEEARQRAGQGVVASRDVAEALSSIAGSVDKVTQLVAEVASASREQAQGIVQVNQAVSQMDQVTQRMAASTEESASTAEELAAQADELLSLVAQVDEVVSGSSAQAARPALSAPQRPALSTPPRRPAAAPAPRTGPAATPQLQQAPPSNAPVVQALDPEDLDF